MSKAYAPLESQRRAAALAVARHRLDRAQVEKVFETVLRARARGQTSELLDVLVEQKLLSPEQADRLRQDVNAPQAEDQSDGAESPNHVPGSNGAHAPSAGHRPSPPPDRERPAPADDAVSPQPFAAAQSSRYLGKFRLLRRLGQGGMGSVYLAYDESSGRQLAVKVLADVLALNPDYVARFYREARSGVLLNHPNVVRCIAAEQDAETGKYYLVLEFVDGPSAQALLEERGRFSVGDAVHIVLDIARALEHAHSRNVIHRDVKPDNILIDKAGIAKLADLGLAKRLDEESQLTALRRGFGSIYYVPYEQAFNAKEADGRSDIYALGATFYHFLTGEVPFPGNSYIEVAERKLVGAYTPASALNTDVPPQLDEILHKMLARDPKDRYQMASELIVDLDRIGLDSAVLSFADPDLALRDTRLRSRLVAKPTQLDLQTQSRNGTPRKLAADDWYIRFRNREGRWCKTRLRTPLILDRLAAGRMPAGAEACRSPAGPFAPLSAFPELRQAASARAAISSEPSPASASPKPAALGTSASPSTLGIVRTYWRRLVFGAIALGALAALVFKLFFPS